MLEGIRNLRNLFLLYEELEEFQEQKIAMGKYPLVPVEKLPLNPQEAYAFSRVDGFSTLSQLEKISRMEKDPFSKLMLALLCLGVVEAERQKVLEFVNRFDKPEKLTSEALPTIALAHLTKQQTQDREKVIKKYLEIQSKTYWEFLEVGSKFTSEELRSTFIKLNKKFHPDTCNAEHLQDLRSHLNQIISHLNLAFNTLNDPNTRRTYIQKTNQKEPLDQHNLMNKEDRLKLAEETYKMGRRFMLQEELFNAYRYLEQAQRLSPNDSRILFDLAMVEMRNPKWQAKARAHLLKVIELAPTHGKAHFALAQIYMESNAKSQAVNHLKQAAEYDPANEEIFVLLEQLTQQGKGSFLDLFGKKKT